MERRQPFLHRVGEAGSKFGRKPPRSRKVRLALQLGLAVVVFGFLVLTVPRRLHGGTLSVACAGPVAMELQHLAPELLARINAHLGRPVVERLRFV
ncbi:MAG: DUF721 domain-containing protein, partial [Solirubrobacterales bacterium]